ncbi:MAG: hypothetical protein KDA84_02720 [Planctomycetaceae bacterium]|nr:hypothetical protein [Planctomycetaceae bacterium]
MSGLFLPQRRALRFDSREVTPELTKAVVHLASEIRSFGRVEKATERVLGRKVSTSTIRRLVKQVGQELANRAEWPERSGGKQAVVPEIAVVSCDGGRIRTRKAGQGRGVPLSGETGWRETKNASFERMSSQEEFVPGEDSCPRLPTSFRSANKVANIAEKPVPEGIETSGDAEEDRVIYEGPTRMLRTAVSSLSCSQDFGFTMRREADRRRFDEAEQRAVVGDGLNWNWSVWNTHFPNDTPILDFIHAIQYVCKAALAMHDGEVDGWSDYVPFITWCWEGMVARVIDELTAFAQKRGVDLKEKRPDEDPHKPILDAIRYLSNNQNRMDSPRYRRDGLPVTSAPMESLIKQINFRVQGTEMFWDDPERAEAILHIRAAALSDDERLGDYLSHRPGWPFVRCSTKLTTTVR